MKIQKYFSLITFSLLVSTMYSQKPTEVPNPSDTPIDLSNPADLIIYIILPICVILLFVIYWRKNKKEKK
ncbi:hypothetical protein [Aequorivita capsosiphonis]|uniref:hypothetical protein n=1 Tax=Aequorivita capsosiphonis TaxID=487317 RepID=UPI0004101276|nr:hypothetical protein [Aequorivita capsosiphonis]